MVLLQHTSATSGHAINDWSFATSTSSLLAHESSL
jgi:hypothetical protein